MKPKGVIAHWHWFKGSEECRADLCVLGNNNVVIWFVEPDVTVVSASQKQAMDLLKYLNFSEEHPE